MKRKKVAGIVVHCVKVLLGDGTCYYAILRTVTFARGFAKDYRPGQMSTSVRSVTMSLKIRVVLSDIMVWFIKWSRHG